jgi:polyhydroxybutyrate depolymerase
VDHRRAFISILFFGALALVACYFMYEPPPAADIATETLTVGNTTRSFRMVVPHKLKSPAPVVFAFHGVGDTPEGMAESTRLDRLAADEGFLLVYPVGSNASWDAVEVEPDALEENADVQFFDTLLEQIVAKHTIDRRRIYLLGMSNGAAFVQLLAHARSPEIAAIVAHSGPCPPGLNSPERKFPILLIVGSEDHAAEAIGSDFEHYQAEGHEAQLIVVPALGHEWARGRTEEAWEFLAGQELL